MKISKDNQGSPSSLLKCAPLAPRYIARVKDVAALRLELLPLISNLSTFFIKWTKRATETKHLLTGATGAALSQYSDLFVEHLGKLSEKICKIAARDQKKYSSDDDPDLTSAIQGLTIASSGFHGIYEGPGKGRHDNDFASIDKVRIVPTHQELIAQKVRCLIRRLNVARNLVCL